MGKNNHTNARKVARLAGSMLYETGIACAHGHVAPRRTINGRCTACQSEVERSAAGKARDRAKYLRDPEAVKARAIAWRGANPVRAGAASVATEHNSRARRFGVPGRLTCDDVLDVLAAGSCLVCAATERLTVDHTVCMTKGGENVRANLQCLCINCNSQKHRSSMEEFMAKKRVA